MHSAYLGGCCPGAGLGRLLRGHSGSGESTTKEVGAMLSSLWAQVARAASPSAHPFSTVKPCGPHCLVKGTGMVLLPWVLLSEQEPLPT
jgi:hypothetical protein